MKKLALFFFLAYALSSCDMGEIPVDAPTPGDLHTEQIEMGTDYRFQHFYDLETRTLVSSNLKTEWDLALSIDENEPFLWLNDALLAQVALSQHSFENTVDTVGLKFKFDAASHVKDSAAFGQWWMQPTQVFVLDRGYTETGQHRGFVKLSPEYFNLDSIKLRVAELENNWDTIVYFSADNRYQHINLLFDQGFESMYIEPEKELWDLVFTQYTNFFIDPPIPYLVTGVLLNAYQVEAEEDSVHAFADIDLSSALALELSTKRDVIGFDWKKFNFDNSTYEVNPNRTFIVKSTEGKYFKLRFTDFYNDQGEKGSPQFEVQAL